MKYEFAILYLKHTGYWRDDLECEFKNLKGEIKDKFATYEEALETLGEMGWSLGASNNSDARGTRELIFQRSK